MKVEDTVKHLEYVAKKESVQVELEALNIIAMKADGAMRDALSIFDQIVSFCGNNVTYKGTIDNLNVLDYDYYFRFVDFFLESKYAPALVLFDEILDKGFDGHNLLIGLCEHFRDLLVCKDVETIQLLEVGAAIKEKYKIQSQRTAVDFLYESLEIGSKADINYKSSKNKRLHVELTLLHLSNIIKKKMNN
jgi:DNA polymerase-3 subunit gamma/tau